MYLLLWIDTYYTALCVLGMYSGDEDVDDSNLFICERHALTDLLDGLKAPCSCGTTRNPWTLDSTIQVRSNFGDKSEVQNHPLEGACRSPYILLSPLSPHQEDLV